MLVKNIDKSILHYNTFGIDAKTNCFIEYSTKADLLDALQWIKGQHFERLFHIGGGSNLLFTKDFNGVILHSAIKGKEIVSEDEKYVLIKVGAGEIWDELVAYCTENGLHGLENLSLIPGEVGASAVQNIGAYGVEASDFIECVEAFEIESGKERVFTNEECKYSYRQSIFKNELKGKYAVTAVTFKLNKVFSPDLDYAAIRREMEKRGIKDITPTMLRQLIIDIRNAKLPSPEKIGSAGSFFMNPIVSNKTFSELQRKYPDIPHYVMPTGIKLLAGWLIEQCGWKGKQIGNVGVYPKQALVLVNYGGASGMEVKNLCDRICEDVKASFGIVIHPEVNIL